MVGAAVGVGVAEAVSVQLPVTVRGWVGLGDAATDAEVLRAAVNVTPCDIPSGGSGEGITLIKVPCPGQRGVFSYKRAPAKIAAQKHAKASAARSIVARHEV